MEITKKICLKIVLCEKNTFLKTLIIFEVMKDIQL